MAEEPHPEVQALLSTIEALPVPPTYALSVESARDRLDEFFADQPAEEVATREDYSIPGPAGNLPVRVYVPDGDGPHPVLVYYHGGGWVLGGLDTHDTVCAALANRTPCAVLSVDYRLAPEHPFPAPLEDAYAAAEWVEANGDRINVDPDRIAIGGDSAGGNLAAAVALMARDRSDTPTVVHQLLVYPAVHSPPIHEFDSHTENAKGYFLERASIDWFYEQYLQGPVHARNEYVAPLLVDDCAGLPPATVVTAGFDPLRDEGRAYAELLADDGVPVEHIHYPGVIHGFISLPDLLSTADEALSDIAAELRGALAI